MNYFEFIKLIVAYSNMKSEYNSTRDNGKYELRKETKLEREMNEVFNRICEISSKVDWETVSKEIKK